MVDKPVQTRPMMNRAQLVAALASPGISSVNPAVKLELAHGKPLPAAAGLLPTPTLPGSAAQTQAHLSVGAIGAGVGAARTHASPLGNASKAVRTRPPLAVAARTAASASASEEKDDKVMKDDKDKDQNSEPSDIAAAGGGSGAAESSSHRADIRSAAIAAVAAANRKGQLTVASPSTMRGREQARLQIMKRTAAAAARAATATGEEIKQPVGAGAASHDHKRGPATPECRGLKWPKAKIEALNKLCEKPISDEDLEATVQATVKAGHIPADRVRSILKFAFRCCFVWDPHRVRFLSVASLCGVCLCVCTGAPPQ